MAFTPDLFEPAETPTVIGAFNSAFDAWRRAAMAADRLQRESTAEVYASMWSGFVKWCVGQEPQITLQTVRGEDLERFLESREGVDQAALTPRYAWRLLSLVDRVLAKHAVDLGVPKNEAAAEYIRRSEEIRRANISERTGIDYLDAEQARRLVTYLTDVRPGALNRRRIGGWQELRNITAVAMHLGAGLTPGDVRALPLDAPVVVGGRWKDVPWKLKVPGNGNRPPRETPIASWAGQLLKYWLTVRAETPLLNRITADGRGGDLRPPLFPGRSGQLWGKMAHYEAVKQVMESAGVDDPGSGSGGAFRLRHTFALRQLRRKKSIEDVARWMGIANTEEMERYCSVVDAYEEAV